MVHILHWKSLQNGMNKIIDVEKVEIMIKVKIYFN